MASITRTTVGKLFYDTCDTLDNWDSTPGSGGIIEISSGKLRIRQPAAGSDGWLSTYATTKSPAYARPSVIEFDVEQVAKDAGSGAAAPFITVGSNTYEFYWAGTTTRKWRENGVEVGSEAQSSESSVHVHRFLTTGSGWKAYLDNVQKVTDASVYTDALQLRFTASAYYANQAMEIKVDNIKIYKSEIITMNGLAVGVGKFRIRKTGGTVVATSAAADGAGQATIDLNALTDRPVYVDIQVAADGSTWAFTDATYASDIWGGDIYTYTEVELIQVSDSLTLAETVTALYIEFVTDTLYLHEFVSYQKGVIRIDEMDLPHVTAITITDEASIIDKKVQGGNLPKRSLEGKIGRTVQIAGWTNQENELRNMDQLLDGERKTLLLPSGDSFAIRVQSVRPSGSAKLLGGAPSSAICGVAVCGQSICGTITGAWAPTVTYTLNAGELRTW